MKYDNHNFFRRHVKAVSLLALLAVLTIVLAGFGGSPQQPLPPASPVSVGQVTNFQAHADAQIPGSVRLSWNAADNAQVYFVVYLKSSEAVAGNYHSVRTKAFTGTEGRNQRVGGRNALPLHRHRDALELAQLRRNVGKLVGLVIGGAVNWLGSYRQSGVDRLLQCHQWLKLDQQYQLAKRHAAEPVARRHYRP